MAIFNSYVKLPEGTQRCYRHQSIDDGFPFFGDQRPWTTIKIDHGKKKQEWHMIVMIYY